MKPNLKTIAVTILFLLLLSIKTEIDAQSHSPFPEECPDLPCLYSTEDKIIALSTLWSELKYNFVNIDRLEFDLDSLYYQTIPEALNTQNDIEYFAVLHKFMRAMNDGHTEIMFESYDSDDYFDYIPYAISCFEGKYYFLEYKDSDEAIPELLGAEILSIDGIPIEEYVEKIGINSTVGTYEYRKLMAVHKAQYGPKYSFFCGTAKTLDGDIIEFKIRRDGETNRTDDDESVSLTNIKENRRDDIVSLEWRDKIGILTINRFFGPDIEAKIDSAFDEIHKNNPNGLIIDLRGNGGGDSDVALRLQMYLIDADSIRWFGAQTRINNAYYRSQGNYLSEFEDHYNGVAYETYPSEYIQRFENITAINCPVAILIDTYSYSACEDFLVNIYEVPNRPVLIGRETGGSSGAPLIIELPHDAIARICSLRITYPYSGKPFGGKEGVKPDIYVENTLENYIQGIDLTMKTAVDYLNLIIN